MVLVARRSWCAPLRARACHYVGPTQHVADDLTLQRSSYSPIANISKRCGQNTAYEDLLVSGLTTAEGMIRPQRHQRGSQGPRLSHSENQLGRLFAAIALGILQALILSLRIADGLGQHLAELNLGLCGFALGWLPCCHRHYVGMLGGELKPADVRYSAHSGPNADIAACRLFARTGIRTKNKQMNYASGSPASCKSFRKPG